MVANNWISAVLRFQEEFLWSQVDHESEVVLSSVIFDRYKSAFMAFALYR